MSGNHTDGSGFCVSVAAKQNKKLMETDQSDLLKSFFTFFNSAGHRSSFFILFKLDFYVGLFKPFRISSKTAY